MVKNKNQKPAKKTERELWEKIEKCIADKDYIIMPHTKKRQIDRDITDIDIIDILENKENRKRKRKKSKDKYEDQRIDWNYCIEGLDLEKEKIRIIVSFSEESSLLVITVIRPDNQEE